MRVKSPLRFTVTILILLMVIYAGYAGIVSILTGEPVKFGFEGSIGVKKEDGIENFVVAGTDKQGFLTDLILLCQYNSATNSLSALQIPRDTKVDNNRSDKKINSAYGSKDGIETMYDEIESVVGIRPEKYVVVSFAGFRELVDAIDGVEFNVPIRMYYTDPFQNLVIDLQAGEQLLNGRRAEMLMRFRQNSDGTGYKNGDVERNETQRAFYQAVIDKLLSGKTILKVPRLLSIVNKNVKTDFTGNEIVKYIGKVPKLSMENINIMALPGEGGYDGGVSYFFHDKEKTESVVEEFFTKPKDVKNIEVQTASVRNKFVKVRIVDATSIKNEDVSVSDIVSETLTAYGFNVVAKEKAERIRDNSELVNHNNKSAAKEVQKVYERVPILKGKQEYEKKDNEKWADVTLIVGDDFTF